MSRLVVIHGAMSGLRAHRAAAEQLCEDCAQYRTLYREAHGWGELDLRPCGTTAAVRRHERAREALDEACRQARRRRNQDRWKAELAARMGAAA
jgi:hypothetical protein